MDKIEQEPKQVNPDLAPYLNTIAKSIAGGNAQALVDYIRELPLERRYVSRILAGLKVSFEDFDAFTVAIDRDTLPREETDRIAEKLEEYARKLKRTIDELRKLSQ